MKQLVTILLTACVTMGYGQYLENFATDGIGVVDCSGTDASTCTTNTLSQADWTLTGDFSGVDSEGVITSNGRLYGTDVDNEVCWESTTLDISDAAGTVSLAIDFHFEDPDGDGSVPDYINVLYSTDGGTYTSVPNQFGGGPNYTVEPPEDSNHGVGDYLLQGTINQANISGSSTMNIKICFDANNGSEILWLDNISVPEANVRILPIKLTSFAGTAIDEGNLLEWTTASESQNKGFHILHSRDGISWTSIGWVDGAGNSLSSADYRFLHSQPQDGTNYYQLQQEDLNGDVTLSQIIQVFTEPSIETRLLVYPNPTSGLLRIMNAQGKAKIVNRLGQVVQNIEILSDNFLLDVTSLPEGIYFIQLNEHSGKNNVIKIVKY